MAIQELSGLNVFAQYPQLTELAHALIAVTTHSDNTPCQELQPVKWYERIQPLQKTAQGLAALDALEPINPVELRALN